MVEKFEPLTYNYSMENTKRIRELFEQGLLILNALGDSNRQKLMLLMLEGEPKSVSELTANMSLSRPSISHHLKILKDARIITEKKIGTRRYYYPITKEYVKPIQELLNEVKEFDERLEKNIESKLNQKEK